jgi:biopolymer transport protein ExbB
MHMNIVPQCKRLMLDLGAAPILYLMIALSVGSVAVILERTLFFRSIREDAESLARDLGELLSTGALDGLLTRLVRSRSSEAVVLRAGLRQAERGPDAAAEAMMGAAAAERIRLDMRLAYLATLGNNAPFVGLLGTVIGIIHAFDKLGEKGIGAAVGSAPQEVMGAIAEALVATAMGLAVAIPAVAAFNYFQRRIKRIASNTESLSRVLLAHLKGSAT